MPLQVSPDIFHRVQLRGVGRKPLDGNPPLLARAEILDQAAAMRRQAIPDDQQFAGNHTQQFVEEDHDVGRFDVFGEHLEIEIPDA